MMYKVFVSILETFLIFGFGALAWRLRMIKTGDLGRLSRLTLDLFFPLLTFSTITRNFDPDNLAELWIMPVLGIAIMLIGAVIGHYLKRFLRDQTPARLERFITSARSTTMCFCRSSFCRMSGGSVTSRCCC